MLVKREFIPKPAVKSEALNSKTSLANQKESFILHLLFAKGRSN